MRKRRGILAKLQRHPITFGLVFSGLFLPGVILYAIVDFVSTAKKKDDQAQSAALKGEAAQFAFALRDDEGIPLVDNPVVLAPLYRKNQVISIKKPFFTYLLNRANAKTFEASNLNWRPPRSCSVDFPIWNSQIKSETSPVNLIRTCFATVKNDLTGRYLYFSLRYPTDGVIRHVAGEALSAGSSVRLEFIGAKTTKITLVYGIPTLAKERYPSQKERFEKVHELSGYYADDSRVLIRSISGQAYEKMLELGGRGPENYVTMLGRVDANVLLAANENLDDLTKMKIGVEISDVESSGATKGAVVQIPSDLKGESVISLEKLYRTQVKSSASLDLYDFSTSKDRPIWQSKSLAATSGPPPSWLQQLSDWLADLLVKNLNFRREAEAAKQEVLGPGLFLTLKDEKASLPDIATRSLLFLTAALVIIVLLEGFWFYIVFFHVRGVIRVAFRFTLSPLSRENLPSYKWKNEITLLGRIVNLLIRKLRSRGDGLRRSQKRERDKAHSREQHMKSRQRILDAMGHELRSPLQTLMNTTKGDDLRVLERMNRAVEALAEATSIEQGLRNNRVVVTRGDLAEYLQKFCTNMASTYGLAYHGKSSNIFARYDEINLEQVICHILENAKAYRQNGTLIEIRLSENEDAITLEIFNQGPPIEEDRLDAIFELGESTGGEGNFGQGLFVAQMYIVVGMKGSIFAENQGNGVSFVIGLPKHAS